MQRATTVIELFDHQVAHSPDAVAVAAGPLRWSYAELTERSGRLARLMVDRGIKAGDRVGVLQQRSPELLVTLLAVLRAGAAYVPIDLRAPAARRREIIQRTKVSALVTDEEPFDARGFAVPVLRPASKRGRPVPLPSALDGELLAYIMYTSGSTGEPKGVATTHRDVVELATDPCWGVRPDSRVLFHAPYAFDASTYEIWVPLLAGAQVVVAPAEIDAPMLRRLIRAEDVSHVHVTAGLFRVLAHEDPACFGTVQEVLTGGDVVSPTAVRTLRAAVPHLTVRHLYGPTEITLCATQHVISPGESDPGGPLPIGTPLADTAVHVLDDELRPATGMGELYLAGAGLARGYIDAPALTAERFVPDPAGPPGTRMYRTGDLGRRGPAGILEFLGRVDDQAKIRGFRVEPGEVEATLADHPRVRQAVVTARDYPGIGTVLVGYVVPAGNPADSADLAVELRAQAAARLPDYMVPAAVVLVSALPLTPHGKLDRGALPTPSLPGGGTVPSPPSTAAETLLCDLFAELTGAARVGIHDDFFELGGHSLLAAQLVSHIAARTGVELSIAVIIADPTPSALARRLASHGSGRTT